MRNGSARDAALWALNTWCMKWNGVTEKTRGRAEGRISTGADERLEVIVRRSFDEFSLDQRDRGLTLELSYGVVRNLIRLDFALNGFIKESPRGLQVELRNIIRLAAYQMMFLDKIPERAAVFEAVEQARALMGPRSAGFINAVLRSFLRGAADIKYPDRVAEPAAWLSIYYSYPRWIADRWLVRYGDLEAEQLMAAGNTHPPIILRANTIKIGREELMKLFAADGIGCIPDRFAPEGIELEDGAVISSLPGYADGLFSVQDSAAQLISYLVSPKPGDRILDACASPGGKSAHLAALAGGKAEITAVDISEYKLGPINENIQRLGAAGVTPVIADVSEKLPFDYVFDAALLDAPCSALGVIRRRPEIKFVRREDDIKRIAALQLKMLDNISGVIKPGGVLVYSVCSTEPEEGEYRVQRFLKDHPDFELTDPAELLPEAARRLVSGGFIRTLPHVHGLDGFFAARLKRKSQTPN